MRHNPRIEEGLLETLQCPNGHQQVVSAMEAIRQFNKTGSHFILSPKDCRACRAIRVSAPSCGEGTDRDFAASKE